MIFCGDLSIPNEGCGRLLKNSMEGIGLFQNQTVVINLEGVIKDPIPQDCFWKVFNDKTAVELKDVTGRLIYSLGNNHTYDFPESIRSTCTILHNNGIGYCGLVEDDVIKPLEFTSKGELFAIFGHCWEIYTRTNCNKISSDQVLSCPYQEFYDIVSMYVKNHSRTKVICFMHWNFDLEKLPLPAYMKLARDLIDAGVWTVIGNHAHCMQEWEVYKGKMIAYGLGNFYMPDGYFFNGTLNFPRESHKSYAVEIDEITGQCTIHYLDNPKGKGIILISSEHVDMSMLAKEINCQSFRKNRTKKTLTPVFKDYNNTFSNTLKTEFVIAKVKGIRALKQMIDSSK